MPKQAAWDLAILAHVDMALVVAATAVVAAMRCATFVLTDVEGSEAYGACRGLLVG